MYGVNSKDEVLEITKRVVSVFGGGDKAVRLLLETACVETHLGTYPDRHPEKLGVGLTQFDQIALDDLQQRVRSRHRRLLKQEFGYSLNDIKLADLAYDATLAMALTRLKYLLVPEAIPTTVLGRAEYWKKYWNTSAGKGEVVDYLNDITHHMPNEFVC